MTEEKKTETTKYPEDWTVKEIAEYEEAKAVWEEEAYFGRMEQMYPEAVLVE